MEDFAFSLVEAELRFFWPFSQEVKVCLDLMVVVLRENSVEDLGVVSKYLHCASDHIWDVIYENDEQYQPQDTPLGDST